MFYAKELNDALEHYGGEGWEVYQLTDSDRDNGRIAYMKRLIERNVISSDTGTTTCLSHRSASILLRAFFIEALL